MNTENTKGHAVATPRMFHLSTLKAEKFWEVRMTETGYEVRYGTQGTAGRTYSKIFLDVGKANKSADRLIVEKLGRGYVELGSISVDLASASIERLIEVASDSRSSSKLLATLVNRHLEVNRAIATNHNATADVLYRIAKRWRDDFDEPEELVYRLIAQHPNTPVDLLTWLGHKFPPDLLRNPALKALILKDPTFLDQFVGIVSLPDCPESYLRAVSEREAHLPKWDMLRNPNLPVDLQKKLTPDYFNRRAVDALQAFAGKQEDVEGKKYVEAYAKNSQSYCIPRFVPFDRSNRQHRLDDQVIRGFPFTSATWPWPLTDDGKPMQPLAQINLEKAGLLLDTELGCGLLQVWVMEINKPLIRIIPPSAFEEDLDAYYPDDSAWNVEYGEYADAIHPSVGLFYLYLYQMAHPRIEWIPAGQMYPDPSYSMSDWCKENPEFSDRKQDQMAERIESLAIAMMWRRDGETRHVHLGGYPGGFTNEGGRCDWSGQQERLLLYVRNGGEDVVFTVQVTVSHSVEGEPIFEAYITCDN